MNYYCCLLNVVLIALTVQHTTPFQPAREVVNSTLNQRSVGTGTTNIGSSSSSSSSSRLHAATPATTPGRMSTEHIEKDGESGSDVEDVVTFSSCFLPESTTCQCNSKSNSTTRPTRTRTRTALIVLNYPIPKTSILLEHLWKTSSTRIAADGGANRLYDYSKDLIPDRIRGDLDSLDPKVRAFYERQSQPVSVEQDFCQDTNDLDKAMQVLVDDGNGDGNGDGDGCYDRVVVYGAFGGRFDQEMASFVALYKWAPRFRGQVYLYSDETCAFLIPANTDCRVRLPFYGTHTLDNNNNDGGDDPRLEMGEGPTCGLIPLGRPCESIVTSGLQWDLDGSTPLEFGGLVSTSNRVVKPTVRISASHPVVFTAELNSHPR
mmetsp:Transcript_11063/g.22319  ORF Transcript_11063/g.22319 Transcript_11063/m.22319 type:complete len:376 (+) Transcript_11063:24-1151(+)